MTFCLLFNDYIFGLLKTDENACNKRERRDCSDYYEYTWEEDLEGTSFISPSELDDYIKKYGNLKYNVSSNNCKDFVYFCLKKLNSNIAKRFKSRYFF